MGLKKLKERTLRGHQNKTVVIQSSANKRLSEEAKLGKTFFFFLHEGVEKRVGWAG